MHIFVIVERIEKIGDFFARLVSFVFMDQDGRSALIPAALAIVT